MAAIVLSGCGGTVASASDTDGVSGGGSDSGDVASTGASTAMDEDPATHVAGTRLQAVIHRSDAGDQRLDHWHDGELGFDCAFEQTSDGFACVPLKSIRSTIGFYADSECTLPAVLDVPCSSQPAYAFERSESCGAVTVLRRTDEVADAYYLDGNGGCINQGLQGVRYEELPLSSLVTATRTLVEDDAALGHWVFEASDGTMQWAGPVELESLRSCVATEDGCLVDDVLATHKIDMHRSDTCDSDGVALMGHGELCPEARFVRLRDGGFGALGDPLEPNELWLTGDEGSCEPNLIDGGSVREIRAIEPEDAPAIEVEDVASGRLRLIAPRSTEGRLLGAPDRVWLDAQLGFECVYHRDREVTQRCVPLHSTEVYFSDDDCSQPVMRDPKGTERGWFRLDVHDDACGAILFGAGAPTEEYIGPVYDLDDGECARTPNADNLRPLSRLDFHTVDELAALSHFRVD